MKRLFAIALLFTALAARAQNTPTVTARVEPDSILIGDRFDYIIDVEKDLVQVVEFPVFDPRDGKIELVENCPVDTLERDGRRLKLRKRYRLAAFDEGKYNLGAAQVLYADKNILDTLRSTDSVYLEVATFQIDSTSQSIYDLKAQKNLPFRFREVSGYVKWGIVFLLALLVAGYALKRYLASRGKGFGDLFKPAPPLPPHVAAIQALEALHNQKLWQNNRHKQYYSGLTDILRTYIAARWGFGAMEMTSDEIIETMRPEELPDKARMDLTAILRDADLVKFAKATPEAEQNEADGNLCADGGVTHTREGQQRCDKPAEACHEDVLAANADKHIGRLFEDVLEVVGFKRHAHTEHDDAQEHVDKAEAREVFFQERDAGKVDRDVLAHPHKRLRNKQGEDDHGDRQTQEHIFGEECFEFL